MTTRFPADNLPPNMQEWRRGVENTLQITQNAQDNAEEIIRSARQSIASNYGLGERLTSQAGSLAGTVYTQLANYQGSPGSAVTLQRSWNNIAGTLTLTTPNFVSNVSIAVAGAYDFEITTGSTVGTYLVWPRISATGGITATRMLPRENYGQVLLTGDAIPANTNIVLRIQAWGFVRYNDGSIANGNITTVSTVRMSATMRAVALV